MGHAPPATRVPRVFRAYVCVLMFTLATERDSAITKSNPALPWRNQWIKNYLCASLLVYVQSPVCVCMCVSKSASFRAPRNRCAYSHMHYSECECVSVRARGMCPRYAWVECCKRLKLRWKWRPGKNCFSPHCCMSGLRFTSLCYYFFSLQVSVVITCLPAFHLRACA